MINQHFLKKSWHLINSSLHFQLLLMSFPKHNLPITRFNSALQTMTQTLKQESSNEHHWYTSKEKLQVAKLRHWDRGAEELDVCRFLPPTWFVDGRPPLACDLNFHSS
jgi:hypothetical protein